MWHFFLSNFHPRLYQGKLTPRTPSCRCSIQVYPLISGCHISSIGTQSDQYINCWRVIEIFLFYQKLMIINSWENIKEGRYLLRSQVIYYGNSIALFVVNARPELFKSGKNQDKAGEESGSLLVWLSSFSRRNWYHWFNVNILMTL